MYTRVDMHVHSSASELSKLGVQRSVALPECATDPNEVYDLAKRRGMDFVTITDHDTIAGVLTIADRDDVFVSEELTAWFKNEPQAVHVLCYGISPDDHDWLQAHNDDVELCAAYLREREITAALAHPFYAVGAPLTARHRRRLAELFPIWETRNGSRTKELNLPAFVYIETHGGTAIGGSDDHAGLDIGRTFTQAPPARTPHEFLAHIRAGDVVARGEQGSAAKWTHAAIALAIRSLAGTRCEYAPDPVTALKLVQRVLGEGDVREGEVATDLRPQDARALLGAWLGALELEPDQFLALLQSGELTHDDLRRRARRAHEHRLASAVDALSPERLSELHGGLLQAFNACVPAIPYAAATAFLAAEKRKLTGEADLPRVGIVADGLDAMHGVSAAVHQIRERGVRGFEVEVIGTDRDVDRRLSAVTELETPYYAGLRLAVPGVLAMVEAIAEGRYDLVHVCTPGPVGVLASLTAHALSIGLIGSYHTELAAYASLRTGRAEVGMLMDYGLRTFYGACELVLSPSPAADTALARLGVEGDRVARWDRGVDLSRFGLSAAPMTLPGEINVLYAGRLASEKGIDLLADAFLAAHSRDPRLHLVLAGVGPEEDALRTRLGSAATFLGWLRGEELARAYASADVFLFASQTDTFGQVILEAQASGLPVIAVDAGGPASLIDHGVSGMLAPPRPNDLAQLLLAVTASPLLRSRLRRGGLAAVRGRSWESALDRLAAGYRRVLEPGTGRGAREIA